jgi:septal ring factor EnvC (AmiA/AmiB activator)
MVTGIDYPTPSQVSDVIGILLGSIEAINTNADDRVTCGDPEDLPGSLAELHAHVTDAAHETDDMSDSLDDMTQERDEVAAERDRAIKERDALQVQLDVSEAKRVDLHAEHERRMARVQALVADLVNEVGLP